MRFRKMSMALPVIGFAGLLLGIQSAQAESCGEQVFQDTKFIICTVKAKENLRLFWKGADGEPYRNFSKVADAVAAKGKTLSFAFNAGMYREDFAPMGLLSRTGRNWLLPIRKCLSAHLAQFRTSIKAQWCFLF